jgi:heme exporter protein B
MTAMRTAEIAALLRLEWALDRRQKHAAGSLLLYVVAAVYVCRLTLRAGLPAPLWNALFWVLLLFGAFNAMARAFQREDKGRQLYLYTLAHPLSVILARTLYNCGLMLVLSLLTLLVYALLMGVEVLAEADVPLFLLAVVSGGVGMAALLTLVSAIAARAGNGLGLVAILGFPILLPLLLVVVRAASLALAGVAWAITAKYLLAATLLSVVTVALAWVLFPYIWRD